MMCFRCCLAHDLCCHVQVFEDSPNVTVIEIPINDGWTRDVSYPLRMLACASTSILHVHLQL